jgi:hypothetical protein
VRCVGQGRLSSSSSTVDAVGSFLMVVFDLIRFLVGVVVSTTGREVSVEGEWDRFVMINRARYVGDACGCPGSL